MTLSVAHLAPMCYYPIATVIPMGKPDPSSSYREGPRAPLLGLMGIGVTVASAFILYRKGVPAMAANPGDSPIEAPESTTVPPQQVLSKAQTIMGCIGSVIFLSVVMGIAVFFGLRCSDGNVSQGIRDEFSLPTPAPTVIEATPTPAIMPEPTISIESAEKMITVCQTVASVMLKLNQQGFTEEQTILVVANELDMTLAQFTDLIGLCSTYYGNLPVE